MIGIKFWSAHDRVYWKCPYKIMIEVIKYMQEIHAMDQWEKYQRDIEKNVPDIKMMCRITPGSNWSMLIM